MPIHVRFARNAAERDAVYRLRAMLSRGPEEELEPGAGLSMDELMDGRRPVARKLDRFDAYPTTVSLLALDGGEPVGTARVVMRSPAGLPLRSIRPHGAEDRTLLFDSVLLRTPFRDWSCPFLVMLKVGVRWGRKQQATRALVQAPPFARGTLEAIGFREELEDIYSVALSDLRPSFLEISPEPSLERLVEDCDRSIFRRGEYIFRRGGAADTLYVVARGRVKLLRRRPDGAVRTVAELGPGELLGEEGGGGTPARRWVDAIADANQVDVWVRPASHFLRQVDDDPVLRRAFHRAMSTRIQALTALDEGDRAEGILRGVVEILLDLAVRLAHSREERSLQLSLCSTRWLAEQLGCREELLAGVLEELSARGLLGVRQGRVTVLDVQGLAAVHPDEVYHWGSEPPARGEAARTG